MQDVEISLSERMVDIAKHIQRGLRNIELEHANYERHEIMTILGGSNPTWKITEKQYRRILDNITKIDKGEEADNEQEREQTRRQEYHNRWHR